MIGKIEEKYDNSIEFMKNSKQNLEVLNTMIPPLVENTRILNQLVNNDNQER